jgi:hypothetical protein
VARDYEENTYRQRWFVTFLVLLRKSNSFTAHFVLSGSFNSLAMERLNASKVIKDLYKENALNTSSLDKLAGAEMHDKLDEVRINNLRKIQWADMKM